MEERRSQSSELHHQVKRDKKNQTNLAMDNPQATPRTISTLSKESIQRQLPMHNLLVLANYQLLSVTKNLTPQVIKLHEKPLLHNSIILLEKDTPQAAFPIKDTCIPHESHPCMQHLSFCVNSVKAGNQLLFIDGLCNLGLNPSPCETSILLGTFNLPIRVG